VTALPKTRSGKIVRKALREAIAGRPFSTGTIEDLTVLESCLEALRWV
jgi:acyl-CoA synthetase (AMP-forming)/AMP-acid ligase II